MSDAATTSIVVSRGPGRPRLPDSVRQKFLDAWAEGRTYRQACGAAGVEATTPQYWRETDAEFASRYDRARTTRAAALADETLELAANATMADYKLAALRIGARQWISERSSRDFASRSEATHNVRTEVTVRLEGGEAYVPRGRDLSALPEAEVVTGAAPSLLDAKNPATVEVAGLSGAREGG